MQSRKMIPILVIGAAALAGCQAAADAPPNRSLAPNSGWISPDAVHSTVNSGSDSDSASGSTVIEQERR